MWLRIQYDCTHYRFVWSNKGAITTRRAMTKNTLQNVVFPIMSDVNCIIDCADFVEGFVLIVTGSVTNYVISYGNFREVTFMRIAKTVATPLV